ncbi:MAG TPA: rRNA pseudouridine synthase [Acholeplasmataceae bacterium]|nr:rRNA pseudouridine synthase [Acholeplasmataceae bacterium]
MERLQKLIARSGYCSRRKAEELIRLGKVAVNGHIITEMGFKVSEKDRITIEGEPLISVNENIYLLMNKPRYIITSTSDDKNRRTVIDLLPKQYQKFRLYPVGRLDYDTKGVLLLTNDGDFMNALVGPKSDVEKEYLVRLDGLISKRELKEIEKGVELENYKTRPCKAFLESVDRKNKSSLARIILKEGKYHQVKEMFAAIGYPVKRLTRIRFGNLTAEGLKEGEVRELKPHEIKKLLVRRG